MLLNKAKDNEGYQKSLQVEGDALLATWMDDEFKVKITNYLKQIAMAKKAKAKLWLMLNILIDFFSY